jgi:hypothetical protein
MLNVENLVELVVSTTIPYRSVFMPFMIEVFLM